MVAALLLSFGVIFIAELGDKSQLMAMTFALRYRWWVVLSGILAATTFVHVLSVAIGHFLGASIPTGLMGIIGGIAFIGFGVWTLRGDQLSAREASIARRAAAPAFFVVISAFTLAELGDKTMLATIALAGEHDWLGVWIGSTLGMVAADALAIVIGAVLRRRMPDGMIQLGAAGLFFGMGSWLLLDGVLGPLWSALVGVTIGVAAIGAYVRLIEPSRSAGRAASNRARARRLRAQRRSLATKVPQSRV